MIENPMASSSSTARAVRRVGALVLGALAIVLVPLAVIGRWANSVVFDGDEIAEITVETVSDPQVAEAFGERLADVALEVVDLVVPGDLPTGLDQVLARELTRLLDSGLLDDALTAVVVDAHELAVAVIEEQDLAPSVSIADGDVAINLLPLAAPALDAAQRLGLLGELEVPVLDARAPHEVHLEQLETALGVDLADDTGLVVVYSSDALADAESWVDLTRRIVEASQRLVTLVSILAVVTVVGALAMSMRRQRLGVVLALGITALALATILVISRVPGPVGALVGDPVWARALEDACRGLVDRLRSRLVVMIALVVVLAMVGVLERRIRTRRGDRERRTAPSSNPEPS